MKCGGLINLNLRPLHTLKLTSFVAHFTLQNTFNLLLTECRAVKWLIVLYLHCCELNSKLNAKLNFWHHKFKAFHERLIKNSTAISSAISNSSNFKFFELASVNNNNSQPERDRWERKEVVFSHHSLHWLYFQLQFLIWMSLIILSFLGEYLYFFQNER